MLLGVLTKFIEKNYLKKNMQWYYLCYQFPCLYDRYLDPWQVEGNQQALDLTICPFLYFDIAYNRHVPFTSMTSCHFKIVLRVYPIPFDVN